LFKVRELVNSLFNHRLDTRRILSSYANNNNYTISANFNSVSPIPAFQNVFLTSSFNGKYIGYIICLAPIMIIFEEIRKYYLLLPLSIQHLISITRYLIAKYPDGLLAKITVYWFRNCLISRRTCFDILICLALYVPMKCSQ
jgi:hypothetical protein